MLPGHIHLMTADTDRLILPSNNQQITWGGVGGGGMLSLMLDRPDLAYGASKLGRNPGQVLTGHALARTHSHALIPLVREPCLYLSDITI